MTLEDFFKENRKVALSFSGGCDSSFLLYAGKKSGCDIGAYFVQSEFQPEFELRDAKALAEDLNVKLAIIRLSVLNDERIAINDEHRCYYCKKHILHAVKECAGKDGYEIVIDGTNASDDERNRPGMKALREENILSPLKLCGITKEEVRKLSKKASLLTYDKPSYSCLSTRIETGERITERKLEITEKAENALFNLGFTDFRIRMSKDTARIQLPKDMIKMFAEKREEILSALKPLYKSVVLDLEVR